MRTITSDFKNEIKEYGRQIDVKLVYFPSYDLVTEDDNNIITETGLQIISEQSNYEDPIEINNEDIVSISIVKNGNLLQSLMKQLNFETKEVLNLGSVVKPSFGLLIDEENEEYEYIDYGNYIVQSKEYNMDTETWSYVCYDKMLFSMIKYKELHNVAFPITLKQYINILAEKVGLEFEDSQFVNQDQLIYTDLYKDRGMTYRDVFDDISKIVAGNLIIGDNDILKVGYPNETNDTIDEEYLKDNNVKFGDKIGVINSVAIIDDDNKIEYVKEDAESIKENEMTRITITDNLIALNGNTDAIVLNIFNKLFGLYYYSNDFSTTGVCYYDFLDLFNVEYKNNTYQCLLLNNEITLTQGIEEHIFTDKMEEVHTQTNDYTVSTPSNKKVQFLINEQAQKIEQSVKQDDIIASLNLAIEDGQGIINLTGNTVTISSDHFKLASDGSVNIDNGAVSINSQGIQLANGTSIVGGNGMLTQFKYSASGAVGFSSFDHWRQAVYITVHIPQNFSPVDAKLIVSHNPCQSYVYNQAQGTRTYFDCYVRNAKLYYTETKRKGRGDAPLLELAPNTAGDTISTLGGGSNGKTFSSSQVEVVEIPLDINIFKKGTQFIYVADYVDSPPTDYEREDRFTGFITLDLFISGYIKS